MLMESLRRGAATIARHRRLPDAIRCPRPGSTGSSPRLGDMNSHAEDSSVDKAGLRSRVRASRRARRRAAAGSPEPRAQEASGIARAALAHFDACPAARAGGWGAPGSTVAVFRSTPSEPDTSGLIAALHERGARVLVPRTLEDMSLDWHELLAGTAPRAADGTGASSAASSLGVGAGVTDQGVAGTSPASVGAAPSENSPQPDARQPDSAAPDSRPELPTSDDVADEGPALGRDAVADVTAMILPGLAVDRAGHRLGQGGGCYDRTLPLLREGMCQAVLLFDDEVLPAVPHDELDRPVPAVLTPEAGWRTLG